MSRFFSVPFSLLALYRGLGLGSAGLIRPVETEPLVTRRTRLPFLVTVAPADLGDVAFRPFFGVVMFVRFQS